MGIGNAWHSLETCRPAAPSRSGALPPAAPAVGLLPRACFCPAALGSDRWPDIGSWETKLSWRQQDTQCAPRSWCRIAFGCDLIKKAQIFLIILPAAAGAGRRPAPWQRRILLIKDAPPTPVQRKLFPAITLPIAQPEEEREAQEAVPTTHLLPLHVSRKSPATLCGGTPPAGFLCFCRLPGFRHPHRTGGAYILWSASW